MQTLLTTYEQIIASLIDETEACLEGDRIDLSLFILEPGDTSERLLAALVEAADRNVSVAITIDDSYASRFARWWEKTQTLLPRATGHAAEREGLFRVLARKEPNHAKYAAFVRRDERKSCALVMSANLGDRFRMWKDYAVRVVGERHVRGLLRKIAGGPGAHPVLPLPPSETAFVANVPPSQRYEIRSVLRTLFAGNAYDRYRIAMAYVDHAGARYLRAALDRGASVEIVMPRKANVYTHA
ncbi:MAG: phospholipase D-like domain-containing protein, partial [Planctomycetota bacterium]